VTLEVSGITDPLPFSTPSDVTVTARDAVGNVATSYLGTVVFTSSDVGVGVVLPANYTFVPGDAGVHTFTGGVTLVTVGEQTVTATDNVTASITGTQSAITVTGGAAVILEVTAILDPIAPGQPSDVVVTAKDGLGNVAASYAGTVTFTSTDVDVGVVLPADYTFVPATDAGVHVFPAGVTLRTTGEQTVTATDNVTGTITGTQAAITVQPGPIDHITLTPPLATLTSLTTQQFIAVAEDAFNNPLNPQPLITWGSTAGGVATVDGAGLASAVGAGTTTISATVGAVSAQATLHVVLNLDNILVTPASPTLTLLGTPQQFTAVARDAGNNPLPVQPTFTWTSSDTTVAIVDATGQAGAGGNGGTTITVTAEGFGGVQGTATLTVNDPTAREIIVANFEDNNLSVIDGSTNTLDETLGGGGGSPFELTLANAGLTTYITNLASDNIAVLNNTARTFGTPIALPASSGPVGIAITPDGANLAIATPGTSSLTLVRTSDNQITTVPVGPEPYEVVAVSNNIIWVTNATPQGYITQYNIATTDTILKEAGFYTAGIAATADGSVLVVAASGSNAVLFFDASDGALLGTLNASDGIGMEPDGLAITSNNTAYVANLASNTVSVIDVDSRSLLTTIPVGNRPRGVTISPDGALVYIVNEGGDPGVVDDSYVSVISTQTNTVVARFTVGLQAKRAVAR
jgi:YVTN family beta-propeller protein